MAAVRRWLYPAVMDVPRHIVVVVPVGTGIYDVAVPVFVRPRVTHLYETFFFHPRPVVRQVLCPEGFAVEPFNWVRRARVQPTMPIAYITAVRRYATEPTCPSQGS